MIEFEQAILPLQPLLELSFESKVNLILIPLRFHLGLFSRFCKIEIVIQGDICLLISLGQFYLDQKIKDAD